MELLEQKLKEYISSVSIPEEILPKNIKSVVEDSGDITAGIFLKRLKDLKISGSEFLELLGNSKIGNAEFRRIEENPHLKFSELLSILDNSVLTGDDYRMIISVASQRLAVREERKKREQDTLARMEKEKAEKQKSSEEAEKEEQINKASTQEAPRLEEPDTNIQDVTSESQVVHEYESSEQKFSDTDDNAEFLKNTTEKANKALSDAEALLARYQAEIDKELEFDRSSLTDTLNESTEEVDDNHAANTDSENVDFVKPHADITLGIENDADELPKDAYRTDNSRDVTESYSDELKFNPEKHEEEETQIIFTQTKAATVEFAIPEPEDTENYEKAHSGADSIQSEEYEDFDSLLDDEEIEPTAENIGIALDDLLGKIRKKPEEASKKPLIIAFAFAAVLIIFAGTFKLLRHFEIIPTYTYKLPTIISQNITDFTTLFEETKNADGQVSYAMPDGFSQSEPDVNNQLNAVGEKVCAVISEKDGIFYVSGARTENGKVSNNFSFETGMLNPSISYANGIFVLTGTVGNMTVIRFYDEASLIEGTPVKEIQQSGKLVGYYTDSNAYYAVTNDAFDLKTAGADTLTSFVPSYTENEKTSVVPFNKIVLPEIAGSLNYFTVARIPYNDGENLYKSVMTGDTAGIHISDGALYISDSIYLNEKYSSTLTKLVFDKELKVSSANVDGAINPLHLMDNSDYFVAAGVTVSDGNKTNTVFRFTKDLTDPAVLTGVAQGNIISNAYCGDEILSLITAGDNPMQYNINLSDLSAAGSDSPVRLTKRITDRLYAGVYVTYDDTGKRTGLVLTVSENGKTAEIKANADSTVQGDWNAYIDSSAISDISSLPVYNTDKKTMLALPVTYFDGISQVSEYRFYSYEKGQLSAAGKISLYDEQYSTAYCGFSGGEKPYILTLWDNRIITVDINNFSVISDTEISSEGVKAL